MIKIKHLYKGKKKQRKEARADITSKSISNDGKFKILQYK